MPSPKCDDDGGGGKGGGAYVGIRGLAGFAVSPDAADATDASGVRGLCAREMSSSPGRCKREEGGEGGVLNNRSVSLLSLSDADLQPERSQQQFGQRNQTE